MSGARNGLWRAYRTPLVIALASIVGLVSALIGDGAFDALSWAALGGIVIVIAVMLRRR